MLKILKRIIMFIVLVVILIAGAVGVMYLKDSKGKRSVPNENAIIEIESGESISSIASKLKNEGIIKYKKLFVMHGVALKKGTGIKYGLHSVSSDMSYKEIYEVISKSEMSLDVYNKVTIPEGFTVEQIATRLSENAIVDKEEFLKLAKDGNFDFWFLKDIDSKYGKYKLEGFLYPQTYYIEKTATEEKVIEMFLQEFERRVEEYKSKYTSKEFYDILKMASIIEKETFIDKEKDIVAGVFYNRLNNDIKLESCATVEYVLNTGKKVLSYEDISVESPYNTYKVDGMTPTPISNPSIESIKSAESPKDTDYMFFVAKNDGSGHKFSKTYEEHLKNIDKYR